MFQSLGLAIVFAVVSIYYGVHTVEKIKEAVAIYRNGQLDKENGSEG